MRNFIFITCLFAITTANAQNNALSILSPSNGYVLVQDNNLLDFSTTLTIEAWIRINDTTGTQSIVHKGWCGVSESSYFFGVGGGKLKHSWNMSSTGNCNFATTTSTDDVVIIPGRCYHVAVTHSATSVKFYVDGIEVAGSVLSGGFNGIYNSNESLRIGIYKSLGGNLVNPINGLLDEVRIWNSVRSGAEIFNNKNLGLNGSEPGLVAYYNFDTQLAAIGSSVLNNANTGATLNGIIMGPGAVNVQLACENLSFLSTDPYFLDEIKNELLVGLFPNPSTDDFNIELTNYLEIKEIQLLDLKGSVLKTIVPNSNNETISMTNYESGTYFFRILSKNGITENRKVTKI